jgi:hypothetical protein
MGESPCSEARERGEIGESRLSPEAEEIDDVEEFGEKGVLEEELGEKGALDEELGEKRRLVAELFAESEERDAEGKERKEEEEVAESVSFPSAEEVEETLKRFNLDQEGSCRVREGAGDPPKNGCVRM